MARTLADARAAATKAVRRYLTASADDRTDVLRELAHALVDMRAHFLDGDRRPDWAGRSYAYRQAVGEVYTEAGLPADKKSTLRAATAYHISNVLHERLTPDELAEMNLRDVSARGRNVERRERDSALMSVLRTGPAISTPAEALHAFEAARALLAKTPGEALAGAPKEDRDAVLETLDEIGGEVARLASAARQRGRRKT